MKYLTGIFFLYFFLSNVPTYSQEITFGDLIPDQYLPSGINPGESLECNRYFLLADSINKKVFQHRHFNPIPEYRCGNDNVSFTSSSVIEAVKEIPSGSILARMILDRSGRPVCCKVYVKDGVAPGKEVEQALGKLVFMPVYKKGEPAPVECRFIYDFQKPRLVGKKVND